MSGRLWRAALDPDLAAAAPGLGAQHRRGLKWNREADVRGELGGRAGSHVWVGLGAGTQPGGAMERGPGGARSQKTHKRNYPRAPGQLRDRPEPLCPPTSKARARATSAVFKPTTNFLFRKNVEVPLREGVL